MAVPAEWLLTIDFGTSFTVAAVRAAGRQAEVIEIDGERRTPSVVYCEDNGGILVGRAAEDLARFQPNRAIRAPKSRIGDKSPVILGGRPYRIVDLVAALLGHVGAEAQRHMGSPPSEVRLTHPATWSRTRQSSLLDAAAQAALPNPVLVPEPVAAAVSYADETGLRPGAHVLVYDLGGGTFDSAILRATQDGFAVVARPVGDPTIGGELFDEMLANLIGERLDPAAWEALTASDRPEWQQAAGALRTEARRVKEALSAHPYADVLVGLPTGLVQQRVTRDEFDELIRPYVEDSVEILGQVLEDADLGPKDLTAIYLAGGASRTPLVSAVLADHFPDTPVSRRGDPKLAVALGASYQQATPSDVAIAKPATSLDTPTPASPLPAPPKPPVMIPDAPAPRGPTVIDHATLASSYMGGDEPGRGTPSPPPPPSPAPPPYGASAGGPPQPPWNSPPPGPPSGPTPQPPRRTPLILAAIGVVIVIIGIAAVLLVGGGDDDSGIEARDDTDTTIRRRTTTDEPTTTSVEATTTTTSTTVPPTVVSIVVPPPPTPAPPTTPAPTAPPTDPPTTPAPPPAGPTIEQLAASVPSLNDFPVPAEWVPVPDVPEIPVCGGFTGDNFPDTNLESRQVFSNSRTLQSAAGLLQSYDSEQAAVNAFLAWNSLFNCPDAFSPEIHPLSSLGAPICTDQLYYYADFFDDQGNFYLRSSIAGQRCGKNVGIWYYDETTDIDVTLSTAHAETFFKTNIYRLAALPT